MKKLYERISAKLIFWGKVFLVLVFIFPILPSLKCVFSSSKEDLREKEEEIYRKQLKKIKDS